MSATIAAAKADIESRLGNVSGLVVEDHEPAAGDGQRGLWVSISTFAITPEFWQIVLRLYADTTVGAKVAQDALDTTVPLIEAQLLNGSYGPLNWTFDLLREDGQMVAACVLDVGREDYF